MNFLTIKDIAEVLGLGTKNLTPTKNLIKAALGEAALAERGFEAESKEIQTLVEARKMMIERRLNYQQVAEVYKTNVPPQTESNQAEARTATGGMDAKSVIEQEMFKLVQGGVVDPTIKKVIGVLPKMAIFSLADQINNNFDEIHDSFAQATTALSNGAEPGDFFDQQLRLSGQLQSEQKQLEAIQPQNLLPASRG